MASELRQIACSQARSFHHHGAAILFLSFIFFVFRMDFHLPLTADDALFAYFDEPLRTLAIGNRANGRFLSGAFVHLFEPFNAWHFEFLYACKVVTIILFACFSYYFCNLLVGRAPIVALIISSLIILLHPYNTTNFDNIINQPNMLISMTGLIGSIFMFSVEKKVFTFLGCVLFLLIVASSYQTMAYYFFVFVLSHSLFNCNSEIEIRNSIAFGVSAVAISLLCYFALHKILLAEALADVRSTNEPLFMELYLQHRSDLRGPADMLKSIKQYGDQVIRSFIAPEPIFTTGPKVFVAGALGLPILSWIYRQFRAGELFCPLTRWRIYLITLLLLLCGSVIHIILQQHRVAPRSIMHASAVMAAIFLFGYATTQALWRKSVIVAGVAVAGLMAWLTADIATNRQILLARDRATLQQIAERLMLDHNPPPTIRIAIVGALPEDDKDYVGDIPNYHDINPSKFSTPWSLIPMLSTLTGTHLEPVSRERQVLAFRKCLRHHPIQRLYLLFIESGEAILCLQFVRERGPHL